MISHFSYRPSLRLVLPESFRFVDRAAPPPLPFRPPPSACARITDSSATYASPPFVLLRGQHQTCRQPRRAPAFVTRASKRLVPSSSYPSRVFSLPPPAARYPRWQRRVSVTHHPALHDARSLVRNRRTNFTQKERVSTSPDVPFR